MKPYPGAASDEPRGREVFYPVGRWRWFALIFPVFGMGMLLAFLIAAWNNDLEAGDMVGVGESIGLGFLMLTITLWIYITFRQVRLVVTPRGIVYDAVGYSIDATWDTVAGVDTMIIGVSTMYGL